MIRITHILIAAALAGCVSAPPTEPFELSISEIYKDPWSFHGKKVRVRGTFDECISFTCEFCETEEALVALNEEYRRDDVSNSSDLSNLDELEKMCMSVSFEDDTEIIKDVSDKRHISIAQNTAECLIEQLARFTTSTIDADYSASCSRVPIKSNKNSDEEIITLCTDRASQLRRAKIVQTHIRRPAVAGVVNAYGLDRLLAPDAETASAIIAAFHKAVSAFRETDRDPEFLFVVDDEDEWWGDDGISALGGACVCEADACSEKDWPKRYGDIANETPANPYTCWEAEEADGVWRFPLQ